MTAEPGLAVGSRVAQWMRAVANSLTSESSAKVARSDRTWRAPYTLPLAPSPAEVLPSLPSKRLKIVCLRPDPDGDLSRQVQDACRDQAAAGLRLSSTFGHDGSVFLVFKRL